MKILNGIVKEIYLLDDDNMIGFKVLVNDKTIDVIEKQNDDNANIFKDDKVLVGIDTVNGKNVYSIMLDGDSNE